ncbi:MAG: hypothetical protein DME41_00925 [Verrucomicrobia bacterium]|nr:MAG: hypothetical protein DME41_00925 [Verrucomicrobiota bacterium]
MCLSLGEDVDLSRRVRFVTTKKVDRPLCGRCYLRRPKAATLLTSSNGLLDPPQLHSRSREFLL